MRAPVLPGVRARPLGVLVPNADQRLKPGMYANATIVVQERDNAISVPVEAVSMAGDAAVLVVNHNGIVQSRPVTVGLTTANRCEILKGLLPGDLILSGTPSGVGPIKEGDELEAQIGDWPPLRNRVARARDAEK